MSIHDYLIDQTGLDWPRLLAGWVWLIPREFEVWLMNRFGDLFLALPDGTIHLLDVGAGRFDRLAGSRDEFCTMMDDDENANYWLMIPLIDELMEAGMTLKHGECYNFLTPPILGGQYTLENTRIIPIEELYSIYRSTHLQLKDLPDGTKVSLKVVD